MSKENAEVGRQIEREYEFGKCLMEIKSDDGVDLFDMNDMVKLDFCVYVKIMLYMNSNEMSDVKSATNSAWEKSFMQFSDVYHFGSH